MSEKLVDSVCSIIKSSHYAIKPAYRTSKNRAIIADLVADSEISNKIYTGDRYVVGSGHNRFMGAGKVKFRTKNVKILTVSVLKAGLRLRQMGGILINVRNGNFKKRLVLKQRKISVGYLVENLIPRLDKFKLGGDHILRRCTSAGVITPKIPKKNIQ